MRGTGFEGPLASAQASPNGQSGKAACYRHQPDSSPPWRRKSGSRREWSVSAVSQRVRSILPHPSGAIFELHICGAALSTISPKLLSDATHQWLLPASVEPAISEKSPTWELLTEFGFRFDNRGAHDLDILRLMADCSPLVCYSSHPVRRLIAVAGIRESARSRDG